jgi:branched-chain amino acid transport system ATP-binding protein
MTNPRLLLLDEPVAGVNPVLVDQIMERIAELRERGLTLLVIEHNIQAISDLSDTLFVMAEGQTLMDGPPRAVMNDPRVLEAYLGVSQ